MGNKVNRETVDGEVVDELEKISEDVDKKGWLGVGAKCIRKALGGGIKYGRMPLTLWTVHCRVAWAKSSLGCGIVASR